MNRETHEVIEETIRRTILALQTAGLMRDNSKSALQKTEELLKSYNALKVSDDRSAYYMATRIEKAMEFIRDDPYYQVIVDYYVAGKTREEIAERFNTSVTTITRNKRRLVEAMKMVLFSDDAIREVFRDI